MTNEEAIQECVKIQAFGVSERQVEAMEMAIKALKQEPCGNAIDRAEAIKIASGYCHPANVAKELAKLPPVNPQPCEDAISKQAVLDAIDVKAWEFCNYLISKNRNDEQKPVSHFADNLRECVREELPSVNLMLCEDAISREDALMCLTGEIKETDTIETIIARFVRRIRKLPSVNPTKTGHWISHHHGCEYECSECHDKQGAKSKYCPNCGAKMTEPQESEDKCKNCEYYRNPDYTRCHECKAESEDKE